MYKYILSIFFSFITLNLFAQSDESVMPYSIIINGALNLAGLSHNDIMFESKANPGFSGGALFRTNGDLYLLAGVQYVSVNPTLTSKNTYATEKVSMQYFQIPVMAGYHIYKTDDLKKCIHAQLGGSFSTLLDVSENSLGIEQDNLKKTGFTVKAGVGADLWIFVADINYNLLLTHVYEEAGYNNKAKLMNWEFSLGVKINLWTKEHKDDVD
ncbi:MAG: outer membrane beta-barrel protein [Bacteroidia bacterium]